MSNKKRDRRRKEDCDRMTAGQKVMWTPGDFSAIESLADENGKTVSEMIRACVYEKLREIGRR